VRAFHATHFTPGRAVLTIVGDFDPSTVIERIKAYFGPIPAGPPPAAPVVPPAPLAADVRQDVVAGVKSPEVWLDWRTPPSFDAGDAELDLFANVIAGWRTQGLPFALVEQQGLATRVTARQISHALGSDFRVAVTVAPGHTSDEVLRAIDPLLVFQSTRTLPASFLGTRAQYRVAYVHGLDRPERRAAVYAQLAVARPDSASFAPDIGRYDAATLAGVSAAYSQWLGHSHRVVTVVTPDPSAPAGGVLRAGGAK
jgi:zinc protease